ncbi:hypothetical protein [Burkholderia ubonensis]|uniref:hypothetical protein n=1 Tax=Burkholderia ubonensis TaxID=101571 RepID=UPI001E4C7B7F|nr:hypothetical protein [Burkholderia ubonensis]
MSGTRRVRSCARSSSINRRGIGTVHARRPVAVTSRLHASSSAGRVNPPVVAAASSVLRSPVA